MTITVMTRNLYLGADITRPVVAAATAEAEGRSPAEIVAALAESTQLTREIVDRTSFPVRARLVAEEMARTRPDLVGLQEVALWRSGPHDELGVPNATTVDYDFLDLLLGELAAAGLGYAVADVAQRADIESPAADRDVRVTMRDAILVRADDALTVRDAGHAVFEQRFSVTVGGLAMSFERGYQWVDVRAGDRDLRFVNTHLDVISADTAAAQVEELLGDAVPPGRDTILVGDLNSDPLNLAVRPGDRLPNCAAYDLLTGAGFVDAWLAATPAAPGFTCGLSETVDDATADGLDHRIDLVLTRTATGAATIEHVELVELVGNDVAERDPETGLWASDHAGVVARLDPHR